MHPVKYGIQREEIRMTEIPSHLGPSYKQACILI